MKYIQCQNYDEACSMAEKLKRPVFISPDFRVYEEIDFADLHCVGPLTANDYYAFEEFKNQMKCFDDQHAEMSFNELVESAQDCQKAWKKCMEYFKVQPHNSKGR